MDTLDTRLLALLRHDARAPVADLAKTLAVSRGTITNRMAKLQREGVITGYTVRLRPDSTPDEIRAWTSLAVEGHQQRVIQALLGEPGVAALHDTNGRWDLLAAGDAFENRHAFLHRLETGDIDEIPARQPVLGDEDRLAALLHLREEFGGLPLQRGD